MKKFFEYLRTDTFRKNLIRAVVGIFALILVVFFSLQFYTRHNQTYPVPELTGLHVDEAIRVLKSQSFDFELDSVYQVDATPGLVIDQDPLPQAKVKKDRTLYLTIITRSAPEVAFPELIEKTFIESRALLNSYGLKLGDTIYRSDIARDVVLDALFGGQPIQAGRNIPKGSIIDLVLGNGLGGDQVEVPDLFGLTLFEVRFALQGSSLNLGEIHYQGVITDSLSAKVILQSPMAGPALVSVGTPIDLYLSNE
jgi:beta-lactam-binding protein with PASTA domain